MFNMLFIINLWLFLFVTDRHHNSGISVTLVTNPISHHITLLICIKIYISQHVLAHYWTHPHGSGCFVVKHTFQCPFRAVSERARWKGVKEKGRQSYFSVPKIWLLNFSHSHFTSLILSPIHLFGWHECTFMKSCVIIHQHETLCDAPEDPLCLIMEFVNKLWETLIQICKQCLLLTSFIFILWHIGLSWHTGCKVLWVHETENNM